MAEYESLEKLYPFKEGLTQQAEQADTEVIRVALAYEQEMARAGNELALMRAQANAAAPDATTEEIIQMYEEEFTNLAARPLSDALLSKGLDWLQRQREEELRKEGLSGDELRFIEFSNGEMVTTYSLERVQMIQCLQQESYTVDELRVKLYGESSDRLEQERQNKTVYNLIKSANAAILKARMEIVQPTPSSVQDKKNGKKAKYVLREIPVDTVANVNPVGISFDPTRRRIMVGESVQSLNQLEAILLGCILSAGQLGIDSGSLERDLHTAGFTGSISRVISTIHGKVGGEVFTREENNEGTRWRINSGFSLKVAKVEKRAETKQSIFEGEVYLQNRTALMAIVADPTITIERIIGILEDGQAEQRRLLPQQMRYSLVESVKRLARRMHPNVNLASENERAIWSITQKLFGVEGHDQVREGLIIQINRWYQNQRSEKNQ